MLSWYWRSIKLFLLHPVGVSYYFTYIDVHGQTQIKFNYQSTCLAQAEFHSNLCVTRAAPSKLISPSIQTRVLWCFKRVRKTARSDYYLCHVCLCARPSVRPSSRNSSILIEQISMIFLAENQLDAPLLIDLFILFFNSLHVSGTMCPSSGETKLY
jgi:hypothetical protein